MHLIYNKIFLEHRTRNHPENPERLVYFQGHPETEIMNGERFLKLVHTNKYIERVKEASSMREDLEQETQTSKRSYEVACYAVGATLMAAQQNGFALVRPPGHHASANSASGFCIFNNMAIVAKYLAYQGKKVFIFDFDLHHGDGTESLVMGDKSIVYFSTHQSDHYPGTGKHPKKNCFNFPLKKGTDDEAYIDLLYKELMPRIEDFKPDIIGLSAGFDAYIKDFGYLDSRGGMKLTTASYEEIRKIIKPYAHFAVLEGGYNPESVRDGVKVFLR